MVYQSLNDLVPGYLSSKYVKRYETRYTLRDSVNKLIVPFPRTNLSTQYQIEKCTQFQIQKAQMVYKSLNDLVPGYLSSKYVKRYETRYSLRDSVNKLIVQFPRTNFMKNSFSYGGAVLWNSLPCDMREAKSLRAAVRKYRLGVCKMKKSKIPKLCQNIGLGKLFLEKYFLVPLDFYFNRTATESVRRLSEAQDHILLKNRLKIKEVTNPASENLNRRNTT